MTDKLPDEPAVEGFHGGVREDAMTHTSLQGSGFDQWLAAQDATTCALCPLDQVGLYAAWLTQQHRKQKR